MTSFGISSKRSPASTRGAAGARRNRPRLDRGVALAHGLIDNSTVPTWSSTKGTQWEDRVGSRLRSESAAFESSGVAR